MGILLRQEEGRPLTVQLPDDPEELPHQDRGEAERGLIQEEEPRTGHQPPGDREHLLLAAGEGPRELASSLP
jgi:hypothetical protein